MSEQHVSSCNHDPTTEEASTKTVQESPQSALFPGPCKLHLRMPNRRRSAISLNTAKMNRAACGTIKTRR